MGQQTLSGATLRIDELAGALASAKGRIALYAAEVAGCRRTVPVRLSRCPANAGQGHTAARLRNSTSRVAHGPR
eukprot:15444344-Alexandrium_andersonii.AAC.1